MRGILVLLAMISSAALAEQFYCEVDQDTTAITGYYGITFTVNDFGLSGYQVVVTNVTGHIGQVSDSMGYRAAFDGAYVRLGAKTAGTPADVGVRLTSNDNVVMVHLMDIKFFNPPIGDMNPVRGSIENTPASGRCKRLQ